MYFTLKNPRVRTTHVKISQIFFSVFSFISPEITDTVRIYPKKQSLLCMVHRMQWSQWSSMRAMANALKHPYFLFFFFSFFLEKKTSLLLKLHTVFMGNTVPITSVFHLIFSNFMKHQIKLIRTNTSISNNVGRGTLIIILKQLKQKENYINNH